MTSGTATEYHVTDEEMQKLIKKMLMNASYNWFVKNRKIDFTSFLELVDDMKDWGDREQGLKDDITDLVIDLHIYHPTLAEKYFPKES